MCSPRHTFDIGPYGILEGYDEVRDVIPSTTGPNRFISRVQSIVRSKGMHRKLAQQRNLVWVPIRCVDTFYFIANSDIDLKIDLLL